MAINWQRIKHPVQVWPCHFDVIYNGIVDRSSNWFVFHKSGNYLSDENECLEQNGGCDQDCDNKVGSYTCSCPVDGYMLSDDNHNCNGTNQDNASLLYHLTNDIRPTCICLSVFHTKNDGHEKWMKKN